MPIPCGWYQAGQTRTGASQCQGGVGDWALARMVVNRGMTKSWSCTGQMQPLVHFFHVCVPALSTVWAATEWAVCESVSLPSPPQGFVHDGFADLHAGWLGLSPSTLSTTWPYKNIWIHLKKDKLIDNYAQHKGICYSEKDLLSRLLQSRRSSLCGLKYESFTEIQFTTLKNSSF
jgi:hypothetical protein